MKTMQKRLFLILALVCTLLVGAFATACGDNVKLSFDVGGATTAIEAVTAKKGDPYTMPALTWEGHFFAGWYDNAEFNGEAYTGEITVPDHDTTYYAKWEAGYELKLDLAGGTLAQGTSYWLRSGDSILSALSGITPEKSGLTFGAWFMGDKEVTSSDRMPASEVTVTAKYKVGYTIEYHLQALTSPDAYSIDASRTETGSDYIGKTIVAPSTAINGFKIVDDDVNITLTERAAENVLKIKYDRESYTVRFSANVPAGTTYEGSVMDIKAIYESTIELPENGFTVKGYRFLGWSTRESGPADYAPGETYSVQSNTPFFAIWNKGYTDSFGGDDIIFEEDGAIVLVRGEKEYHGTLDGNGNFTVTVDGHEVLRGKLFGDKFSYYREAYAETFTRFDGYMNADDPTADPIITTSTLKLDGTSGATYTYTDESGTHTEEGAYEVDLEDGSYLFKHADSGKSGDDFHFLLAHYGEEALPVFAIIGDEAGSYQQFVPVDAAGSGLLGGYIMDLDGYGGVTYYLSSSSAAQGRYRVTNIISASSFKIYFIEAYFSATDGSTIVYSFQTIPLNSGLTAFVFRNDAAYGTFKGADGSTLELDGYGSFAYSAILTVDGVETYYSFFAHEESEVFGLIVDLIDPQSSDGKVEMTIRLTVNADGELAYEKFDTTFTEYYWLMFDEEEGSPELYSPLLVLYEDVVKQNGTNVGLRAEVYAVLNNELVKAASGYYNVQLLGDGSVLFYTFTRTSLEAGFSESSMFESIGFLAGGISMGASSINVYYVFTYNGEEDYVELTEQDGDGYIWYYDVGIEGMGALYFTAETGKVYEGSFAQIEDVQIYEDVSYFEFVYFDMTAGDYNSFYFAFYLDDLTFEKLDERPLALYYRTNNGGMIQSPTLYLDGAGNALYLVVEEGRVVEMAEGTYVLKETTSFGDNVYTFTPDSSAQIATAFEFAVYVEYFTYMGYEFETPYFFIRETSAYAGTLNAESGATLEVDGYYLHARYTSADGARYFGIYYIWDDANSLYFYSEDAGVEFIFDINSTAKSFTVRDAAAGEYQIVDDSYILVEEYEDYTIVFDGYGVVKLMSGTTVIANGAYEAVDAAELIFRVNLEYVAGGQKLEWIVQLVLGSSQSYCALMNEDAVGFYVADDLSMLYFDGFGYGYYIDEYGFTYQGYYTFADDTHVLFTLSSATLFVTVDAEKDTFEYIDNSEYYATFYAADFGSVVFGDVFYVNGQETGFYVVNGKTVTLYSQARESEPFVTSTFELPEGDTWTYGDVSYTRYTEGKEYTLTGSISAPELGIEIENATLKFTPDGTASLNAPATVDINQDGETHHLEGFTLTATYVAVQRKVETDLVYAETDTSYPVTLKCDIARGSGTFEAESVMTELSTFNDVLYAMGVTYLNNSLTLGYYAFGDLQFSDTLVEGHINSTRYEDSEVMYFLADGIYTTGSASQYYGDLYQVYFTGTDEKDYLMEFFIIDANLSPWEGEGEGYLLIFAISKYSDFETDDGLNNFVARVYTCCYSEAFADSYPEGSTSVELYLKTEEGLVYLEPDENRTTFDPDGNWIVWVTPSQSGYFYWFLTITHDEDDNISAITTQQYIGGTLASEDGFGVRVLLSAEEDEETDGVTFTVEFVYGFGLIDGQYYDPLAAIITENEDGTWTAKDEADTWEYTISFEEGEDGIPVCTVETVKADTTTQVFKDYAYFAGLQETDGTLTITNKGAQTTLSGNLSYVKDTDNKPISFTDVSYTMTGSYDESFGYLYMAEFETEDGNTYSISFYLFSYQAPTDPAPTLLYLIYNISIIKGFDVEGYHVDLEQCYYVSPILEGVFEKGEIFSAGLFTVDEEGTQTPVELDDYEIGEDTIIWMVYEGDTLHTYTLKFTLGEDKIATAVEVTLVETKAESTVYTDAVKGGGEEGGTITVMTLGDMTTFSGTLNYAEDLEGNPLKFEGLTADEYEYEDGTLYQVNIPAGDYYIAVTFQLGTDGEGNNVFTLNDIEIFTIFDMGDGYYAVIFQFWYAHTGENYGFEQYDIVGMNYLYGNYAIEPLLMSLADDNSYIIFVAKGEESYVGVVFNLTYDDKGLVTSLEEDGAYYMGMVVTGDEDYGFYFLYDYNRTTGFVVKYVLRVFTEQEGELYYAAATWKETSTNVWEITLEDGTTLTATFSLDSSNRFVVTVTKKS